MTAASTVARPATTGLPVGFRVVLDAGAVELRRGLWFGGQPARVVRLSPAAADALDRLRTTPVADPVEAAVARRLVDAGLAHPVPPPSAVTLTVVVPVRDRPDSLARCLAGLADLPVVVVDDGSADPAAVAAVAARHGARLVRLPVNRGPAAARNAGLAVVATDVVALADSDTTPAAEDLRALAAHLADPAVAAVAPRVTGTGPRRSALDLGPSPARVAPYTRVSYVPTAVLVARRDDLLAVARDGAVFDEELRVGEDVDLVWRLLAAGRTVRYEPGVTVAHDEPVGTRALLARRFRYGTSAAPLARRHPDHLAPLLVHPWFAASAAALLARRPVLAAAAATVAGTRLTRRLRAAGVPTGRVPRAVASGVGQTLLGTGRWLTQVASPLLVAGLADRRTRPASLVLLLGPPVADWWPRRREVGPVPAVAASLADQVAYGAGVLAGCVRHRTTVPLRPRPVSAVAVARSAP